MHYNRKTLDMQYYFVILLFCIIIPFVRRWRCFVSAFETVSGDFPAKIRTIAQAY
jgi:hypothetical protein